MAKKKRAKKTKKTVPVEKTVDPEVAKLREENAKLKADKKSKKGIPDAKPRTIEGEQDRPSALMKRHLSEAAGLTKDEMTEGQIVSVEYEIRKCVKKGGSRRDAFTGKLEKIEPGWRKGISEDKKAYTRILLARMGRDPEKPAWDESIQVPGMSATLKGQSHKL